MKKMIIFDPAMCCSTGVCGPSVNKELLRVSTVLNTLKNKGVLVERYNLTSNPQAFIDNKEINHLGRILGCPEDKGAGVYLHKNKSKMVNKGEKLITLYSESTDKLKEAIKVFESEKPFILSNN